MTKKVTKIIIILILLAAVCVGLFKYIGYRSYCDYHFQGNTVINGVNVSGMTKAEAAEALTDEWNSHTFKLVSNGEAMLEYKPAFKYKLDKPLQELMSDFSKAPLFTKITGKNKDVTIEMNAKNSKKFNKAVEELDVCNDPERIPTTNAYVSMNKNRKFKIVSEVYGTNIDPTLIEAAILSKIAEGSWELEYVDSEYYVQPEIVSTSQEVLDRQAFCKKYLSQKITYKFGPDTYTISPSKLETLIKVTDGKLTVNAKKVKSFVKNLAEKYDTIDNYHVFMSTLQGEKAVTDGTYGYRIDQDAEKKQLTKDIKSGKDVGREPVYSYVGYSRNATTDILGTYVEVDLSNQHLWYYENGTCRLSSPFVSGCVKDGFGTSTGAYYLVYKAADVKLKGRNADGSKYSTPVKYWMPFYADLGLHDASWRSSFGGSIYINGGSHGCVNMPVDKAGQLFNMIPYECPVLVFY